jgi:hypothetical protein
MADQSFGVKQLNLLGSGVPTIDSPSDINLNANNVAVSTNLTVGNKVTVLSTGIVTAVSGIVSYFGDGSNLSGIGSYAGLTIKDEGSSLATLATTLDFVGAGVTASGTAAEKTITVAGLTVADEGSNLTTAANKLDFVGSGVSASGTGETKTITISGGGGGGGVTSDSEENTVAGTDAGDALDADTYRNTLYGYEAGKLVSSGDDNTCMGWKAGDKIAGGNKNCAVGSESLEYTTSGSSNVAMGWEAGRSNSSGNNNTMIGDMAGRSMSGNENIAIGYHAYSNGGGTRCIGMMDGSVWLGGTDVIGIGKYTVARGGSQTGSIGIGYYAGRNNVGDYSIYIGYESGKGYSSSPYTNGDNNIGLGYRSLYVIENGTRNIAIGNSAGEMIKTGSGNVMIGMGASCADDATNQIVLGNTSSSADNTFKVAATAGSYQGNNSGSWSTTSDRRIKKNIVDNTVGLDKINQLRVRNFEYRTEDEITDFDNVKASVVNKEGVQLGVIAQEIEEVLPDTVNTMSEGIKTVNPENLTWYLINAVKELSAKNNELEERIKALES